VFSCFALFPTVSVLTLFPQEFLVEHGARLDVRTRDGATPFLLAARRCDFALDLLLSKGVSVNDTNSDGQTALHITIPFQSHECIEKLIAAHVPIDEPDNVGMTPLMLAAQNNRISVVDALLRAGADKFKKNKEGRTAAELSNDPEIRSAFN
jgi:ankyrin repeat protein